jgi:hypothetical protein
VSPGEVGGGGGGSRDLIIVSAADSGYFSLLRDMVGSIRALRTDAAIGVYDLGLAADERAWLAANVTHVVRPGWDIEFRGRKRAREVLKADIARPFVPQYFPGYGMYFWLDADAWLQHWEVVDLYCAAAGDDKLAIVPEIDRAYKRHYKRPKLFGWTLQWKHYREGFGWRVADRLGRNPMINSGAFAARGDAPHWAAWQRATACVLQRSSFTPGAQIALNYIIFAEHLPVNFLPSYCNWMPGDAAPAFDAERGLFVEPHAPHEVIGIMHLAGAEQKSHVFRLDRLDGGTVETTLRYSATRDLCKPAIKAGFVCS